MPEYCIDVGCSSTYYSDPWYDFLFAVMMTLIGLGMIAVILIRRE